MGPSSRLVTAERDGYFVICPSPRPNPGEDASVVKTSFTLVRGLAKINVV